MAAASAVFAELFSNLPAAAAMLSDDNIKEFLVWLSDKPREAQGYTATKVWERLTGQARLLPPPPTADLVKAALTLIWGWDATVMVEELGLPDQVLLQASRMLEEAFDGAYAQPWDYDDEKES